MTDESNEVHQAFLRLIEELESKQEPTGEHRLRSPFANMYRSLKESNEEPFPELVAELIAFEMHAHDRQDPSAWGLYFGPMMSGRTENGDAWETPALSLISPYVLDYWSKRAKATRNPVMRARYADLLWEIPRALEHSEPDAAMARVAVDSYLEAIENRRYEHDVEMIAKAQRALDIALSLRDQPRANRCKDLMLRLEEELAEDDKPGLWGFCFDTFVEPPHKLVPLSSTETDRLVEALEDRLERFAAAPPHQYHPAAAESAAIRLANYYRRRGSTKDVQRVMTTYGAIVQSMQGVAAPLLTSHSLEQLYTQYRSFGLNAEADQLNEAIRTAGKEALSDLKPMEVEVTIPTEKIEAFFESLLSADDSEAVLARIAVHFLPNRKEVEDQVKKLAADAPISYLFSHTILDEDGRTVAIVGPLEEDLEGHIVRQLSQNLQLGTPWLREAFERGFGGGVFSRDDVVAYLTDSPLFLPGRHPILEAGVAAYHNGDSLAAVHLLIPQIEQALRQLAVYIGAPIYTQRRGGGLHVRTLDELLRNSTIAAVLGEDVTSYLRVLLTDARGWNLRNRVCHGLASVAKLTMPVADRVIHALLVLGSFREQNGGTA